MSGGPGGSRAQGGKVKDIGLFYKTKKSRKRGEAASMDAAGGGGAGGGVGRGGGARGRGARGGPATRRPPPPVVPTSPIPSTESDREQEEEQHEEEDQEDEEMAAQPDSDSGSEVELEDDEVVEGEFVESDEEIQKLNLPRKEKVFLRGPAKLPKTYEASHFQLAPAGKKSFRHVTGKPPRSYSGILGCLVRKHFPGRVKTHDGVREVAWTWKHYFLKADVIDDAGHQYATVGHRRYFTSADGTREVGTAVLMEMAQKTVHDMHYEGRVGCVVNWYAEHRKVSLAKKNARDKHLKAWQYLQVPPQWCRLKARCFRQMVKWWTSAEYKREHVEASARRAKMGGPAHRQGNLSLQGVQEKKEIETGVPVSLFRCFIETRTRDEPDPDLGMWTIKGAQLRHDEYTSSYKGKYGEDSDPLTEPFDPEVAVLAGEGRRNGRLWTGDGSVDPTTIPSLTEVRSTRTGSNPPVQTRPKPSEVRYSEIKARLDDANKRREEAEIREAGMREAMAAQQRMIIQQHAFMTALSQQVQALSSASGGTSLPSLPPLPPLSFGLSLHPSAGSNNVQQGSLHESPTTPTTASQPQPPPNTSNIVRRL